MKATVLLALAALALCAGAEGGGAATNVVALTDAEAAAVARMRAADEARRLAEGRRAARRRAAGIAGRADAYSAPAPSAASLLPPAVSLRRRLLGMDAESVPGKVVYSYAQGVRTWCETNELRALAFRAARNRYSKLRIIVAAKAAGRWDALKAGIRAAGIEDEWLACQYVEDGDPAFVAATNAVVAAGIATAEEIAAFLERAIDN